MRKFAAKKPVLFEFIVIVAAFVLALAIGLVCQTAGFENEFSMAVGRILAGLFFLIVFIRCFKLKKTFSGFVVMLPALLFALWNVVNHFMTKGEFNPLTVEILILGLAPAVFEEVIFRGIFIHNLKASGKSNMAALIIPALIFGAVHLTNAVGGGDMIQALVQTGYAVVVGLVFGAIYIRTGDIFSVIFAHASIDITNRVFAGAATTPVPAIVAFVVLLALETVYAFAIVSRSKDKA